LPCGLHARRPLYRRAGGRSVPVPTARVTHGWITCVALLGCDSAAFPSAVVPNHAATAPKCSIFPHGFGISILTFRLWRVDRDVNLWRDRYRGDIHEPV